MKRIKLTQNKWAIVDDEDFGRIIQYKWYFEHGYARRDENGKNIYMHRFILGIDDRRVIDHKNRDGLDNRKENLRICNQSLNCANQRINSANTSGYKGVSWNKTLRYWTASVKLHGKTKVKYFNVKEDAAKAYNEMALEKFGEYALLNKI